MPQPDRISDLSKSKLIGGLMDPLLAQFMRYVRTLRWSGTIFLWLMRCARSLLLAGTVLFVWTSIRPDMQLQPIVLALVTFIAAMFMGSRSLAWKIDRESLLKSLEVKYPEVQRSAFSLNQSDSRNGVWRPMLEQEKRDLLLFEMRYLRHKFSSIVVPALLFFAALQLSPQALSTALNNVQQVVAELRRGAELVIVEGSPEELEEDSFTLDPNRLLELTLLEQNMIEIRVVGLQNESPYVTLKPHDQEDYVQTFRLTAVNEPGSSSKQWLYSVRFSVQKDSLLFVSSASATKPVASVSVKKLPVPVVDLEAVDPIDDVWPDDKPLNLKITAEGRHPLQLLRLLIRVEGQEYQELVNNILATDKFQVTSEYSILLESYTKQDISEIEIVAEAIDRHIPTPLVGRSRPLVIKTASAYGRYRTTLQTLREIKSVLDETRNTGADSVPQELSEMMEKAQRQAEESPFFDGLDRHLLRSMQVGIDGMAESMNREDLLRTSEELNRFLFEHETLDDRERDRDFFVAARSLSRVIEQKPEDRKLDVETVTERMSNFLEERQMRWQLRTQFLEKELTPKEWNRVKQRPFQKDLKDIQELSAGGQTQESLQQLSQTVAQYRSWIEALEKAEDDKRREMESERQQGLADARNNLRELQKRQGKVSQKLDRAAMRPADELKEQWASVRMEQNANIEGTASLEGQLRSLSPLAAERIKAALQNMENAVEAGNEQAFAQAESSSDLAGRLLRQADSAARRSQQQRQGRGRRRRVTSDQYYGSPVAGGDVDIRREYRVNPRYREEILDQVRRAQQTDAQDEKLLERYMRQIIR